jgi:hypothetical protein
VIPVTGETYPPGTVRLPKGEPAVAAPTTVGASPAPAPAPVAQQVQAGASAVAAPAPQAPQASVVAAKNASTVPRRANPDDPLEPETVPYVRVPPPHVNKKEWVAAETKRLAALAGGGLDAAKNLGEQAGKLAVAEQYLANAPKIREKIAAGEQTGLWDRTMAVNNIGEQGHVQGLISSGVDALVHMMTGAGMSAAEAQRKVGRYEPALLDTPDRLLAKHDQLVSELTRWRELAYRGKGAPGELPAPAPAYGADSKPLEVGGKRAVGGGTLERVK